MCHLVRRRRHVLHSHLISLLHGELKIRDLLRTERFRSNSSPFLLWNALLIYFSRDFGGILLFCNALGILTNNVLDIRAKWRKAVARIFTFFFPRLSRLLFFLALVILEGSLLTRRILKAAIRTRGFHVSLSLAHSGRRLSTHIPSIVHLVLGVTTASGTPRGQATRILTVAKYLR